MKLYFVRHGKTEWNQEGLDNASLTILETDDNKNFNCLLWNDKPYLDDKIH